MFRVMWTSLALTAGIGLASAAAAQDAELSGVARVMTNQLGSLPGMGSVDAMRPATVYFRGDALRIEFTDGTGKRFALIQAAGDGPMWIVDGQGARAPVPGMHWALRFDPRAPCTGQGMFANCQPAGQGLVAGRNAVQWRYRLTSSTGPGATRSGQMWVDTETGLVLGYRGERGLERSAAWQVQDVEYRALAPALFDPRAVAIPGREPPVP